jgi:hypothetical protein
MKIDDLMNAMGEIDGAYIAEAEERVTVKKRSIAVVGKRFLPFAACFILLIAGSVGYLLQNDAEDGTDTCYNESAASDIKMEANDMEAATNNETTDAGIKPDESVEFGEEVGQAENVDGIHQNDATVQSDEAVGADFKATAYLSERGIDISTWNIPKDLTNVELDTENETVCFSDDAGNRKICISFAEDGTYTIDTVNLTETEKQQLVK